MSAPSGHQVSVLELLRLRTAARLTRLLHWEYWPAAVVYAPLIPWFAWLALRYRAVGGATVFTAANPAIPLGGLVGESKFDILSMLPPDTIIPSALIAPGDPPARAATLDRTIRDRGWTFPIILKPDIGERGAGVRLIRDITQAQAYFRSHTAAIVAQQFHPGPLEVGVFYIRDPHTTSGRIFSITDKRFPAVVGDGLSSLRTLIWRHPRHRAQASVFLRRLGPHADHVPPPGERVPLGNAGNHCQGTMFLDGSHLITPELTRAIDRIARHSPGFAFGRFDLRYTSDEDLRAGQGFKIVELNGVLSESTNIYDPETGFWAAQRILREQWRLAYAIGAANRTNKPLPSLWHVLRTLTEHAKRPHADHGAD